MRTGQAWRKGLKFFENEYFNQNKKGALSGCVQNTWYSVIYVIFGKKTVIPTCP